MESNEYLNEDKFKKNNKKVKKVGVIVLTIGLIMLIGGIVTVIKLGVIDNKPTNAGIGAPFIIIGLGVSIWGLQIRFLLGNQREISAYMVQQQIPIAQEGMEKMAPSIGKAGATIAKEMAPAYGDIAKEISKGIKEGAKESDDSIYCKYCGSQIDADSSFCKKCGKRL